MKRQGRYAGLGVLLTGASSGIGAALARELAAQGAGLVLFARRADRIRELAAEIQAKGGKALAFAGDVTHEEDLRRGVQATVTAYGHLDVAIANAGFGINGRFDELTIEDYRRQFETNVFGLLHTAKAAFPELEKSKGRLVLVGSAAAYLTVPGVSAYHMSKYAVRAFAETAYGEFFAKGVAVTLVTPGFIETEIRLVDKEGRLQKEAVDEVPAWLMMKSTTAARQIASGVWRRKREVVLTLHARFAIWGSRWLPWLIHWAGKRMAWKAGKFAATKD